jgi:hypothetical protein
MRILFFVLISFVFHAISCKKQSSEIDVLYKQVMLVHDEVMPRMKDIHEAKKELGKIAITADSIESFAIIRELDAADESMMLWMNEFKADYNKMDEANQKAYLDSELKRINKVRQLMLNSLEKSKSLVKKKN